MNLETELRERLASAATGADRWDDDWAAADAVIDRRRVEKRHRAVGGALAAVCAVVIGVLVPTVGSGLFADSSAPPADGVTSPDPWDQPARGSLAGDDDYLAGLRALLWPDLDRPDARRVLFAGDAGGRRWALVAGQLDGQLQGVWFTGDTGAGPSGLSPIASGPLSEQGVTDAADAQAGELLVLARPGDRVDVSTGLSVDAAGRIGRAYQPAQVHDGVAVVDLPANSTAVRYDVSRNGQPVFRGPVVQPGRVIEPPTDLTTRQGRRPGSTPVSATAVRNALDTVLTATGLTEADAHPDLLWSGAVPRPTGSTSEVAVVALTMPSGAVVVSTGLGGSDSGWCGTSVHPAGTAVDDIVAAADCEVGSGTVQRWVVVSAPADATQVAVLRPDGGIVADQALTGGAAALPDPGSAESVTVTGGAAGATTLPLSSWHGDPFLSAAN